MKKSLKLGTFFLAMPLLMGGLAGCGNPTDDGTIKVKFWHTFGQTVVDALNSKIVTFESLIQEHDGLKVDIVLEYQGSYDDIKGKISKGFAVDNIPTIAVAYPDHVADYLEDGKANNKEYVANLDNFINDPEIGFGKQEWLGDEYEADDFIEDFIAEGSNYIEEGTYSLPYMKSTEVMFYNMDLLIEVMKVYKPEFENSHTMIKEYMSTISWDDFMDLCECIKENFVGSDLMNMLEVPAYYDSDANFFITKMYQNEIPFASIKNKEGNIDFGSGSALEETTKLLADIRSAHKDGLITTKGIINKYGSDYFTNEKTIFSIGSSGGAGYNFPKADAFELGICRVPASNDNPIYVTQGPTLTLFNNSSLSAEKNQTTLETAWKFMKYITNGQVNAELCVNGSEGYVPVRYSAYETELFQTFMEEGEKYAQCYNVVLHDINEDGGYLVTPTFKGSATLREECGSMLTAVLNSKAESDIPGLIQRCIDNTLLKM